MTDTTQHDLGELLDWALLQHRTKMMYACGEINESERVLARAGFVPARIHGGDND